ncbi:hypothetical protein V8C35DRAFT_312051 [Trichoderma chlorosporum]
MTCSLVACSSSILVIFFPLLPIFLTLNWNKKLPGFIKPVLYCGCDTNTDPASIAHCETSIQTCSLESNCPLRESPQHPPFRDRVYYDNYDLKSRDILIS